MIEGGTFKPGMEDVVSQDAGIQTGESSLRQRIRDLVGGIIFKVSNRLNPLGATEGEDTSIRLPVGEKGKIKGSTVETEKKCLRVSRRELDIETETETRSTGGSFP